jgi:hypothetical protein
LSTVELNASVNSAAAAAAAAAATAHVEDQQHAHHFRVVLAAVAAHQTQRTLNPSSCYPAIFAAALPM